MYDYKKIKREYGRQTNKVLSEPTMVFDFLELREALLGMFCFLYFGIIDTRPMLLLVIISLLVTVWPPFREKIPKGFFLHKISRYTPVKIPNFLGVNGKAKLVV